MGFLALGTAGYLVAQRGMSGLIRERPYKTLVGAEGGSNVEIWGRYWQLSRASLLVSAIGIAVGIWSFVVHHRTSKDIDGQADGS